MQLLKPINAILFGLALMTGVASAAPVSCPAPPPPAQTVDTFPAAGPSNYSYACGGLTFSNFEVVDAGATLPAIMTMVDATFDAASGVVVLNFNPNLVAMPSTTQDVHFYFQVSGLINGIDLGVGGTQSTITERACSTAIDRANGNNCTGGLANQLAVLTNMSGNANVAASFPAVSTAYIFKDINADGRVNGAAELTTFSQSFHTSAVPEPMSLGLMGSGLGLLAVLRRRK